MAAPGAGTRQAKSMNSACIGWTNDAVNGSASLGAIALSQNGDCDLFGIMFRASAVAGWAVLGASSMDANSGASCEMAGRRDAALTISIHRSRVRLRAARAACITRRAPRVTLCCRAAWWWSASRASTAVARTKAAA